jgi:hypothetical protein
MAQGEIHTTTGNLKKEDLERSLAGTPCIQRMTGFLDGKETAEEGRKSAGCVSA